MFNRKPKPQPKRLQQPEISPINTVKINALSQMYENLPKSGFSKLVVTFCLCFSLLAIVASFVFLWFGMDASSLLVPALGFFGSELLVLGATNIFSKEKTKDDLIFDQIRHDLNDGAFYDSQTGRIVYTEEQQKEIDDSVNKDEQDNLNNEDKVYISNDIDKDFQVRQSFEDKLLSLQTTISSTTSDINSNTSSNIATVKKRGRPKKQTKVENVKKEDKIIQEGIQNADWVNEDMSD